MTNVSDVVSAIQDLGEVPIALSDAYDFFCEIPQDLDLVSALFYLKKEFKRNDVGIDDRNVGIYTDLDEDEYSGLDFEEEDDWDYDY